MLVHACTPLQAMYGSSPPSALMSMLSALHKRIDELCELCNVTKVNAWSGLGVG